MASLSGKDILLIDDAEDVRLLAKKILEVDGAVVTEASGVDAGVAASRIQIPHLIIVDLEMPEKTGFDFLDRRRSDPQLRAIPTIVFSAKKDLASVQRAFALEANDYILKPFRATLMLQKVRKALRLSSFSSRKFPAGEVSRAVFTITAEVIEMNEVGCVIESPVKLAPEEDLRVRSDYFRELGIEEFRMRATLQGADYFEGGRYRSEVSFIGIDREIAAKLRTKLGSGK